jgi:hypothetical protein
VVKGLKQWFSDLFGRKEYVSYEQPMPCPQPVSVFKSSSRRVSFGKSKNPKVFDPGDGFENPTQTRRSANRNLGKFIKYIGCRGGDVSAIQEALGLEPDVRETKKKIQFFKTSLEWIQQQGQKAASKT